MAQLQSLRLEHLGRSNEEEPPFPPWLPPSACLLPDEAVQRSPTLGRALAKLGVPLLGLPAGVAQMMATLMPVQHRPRIISPEGCVPFITCDCCGHLHLTRIESLTTVACPCSSAQGLFVLKGVLFESHWGTIPHV
eukprot:scaffold22573_cov14-Tisochrysis_lutea.AAC.1